MKNTKTSVELTVKVRSGTNSGKVILGIDGRNAHRGLVAEGEACGRGDGVGVGRRSGGNGVRLAVVAPGEVDILNDVLDADGLTLGASRQRREVEGDLVGMEVAPLAELVVAAVLGVGDEDDVTANPTAFTVVESVLVGEGYNEFSVAVHIHIDDEAGVVENYRRVQPPGNGDGEYPARIC